MKYLIEKLVRDALGALPEELRATGPVPGFVVERTRDTTHGDFATNVALQLAKAARRKPRELAQAIVAALPASELVARVEIAGPGFINFFLAPQAYQAELLRVLDAGRGYGRSTLGAGRRVMVEFVSANPTGPLHVGHGRHAAFGASLANVLDAAGYSVYREYYINDAGRQMDILAASVWLRYLECFGEQFPFPSNGYRGDYLHPIANQLVERAGRTLVRPAADVFADLPPDAPAGDKDVYIDAVIDRAKALLGAEGFRHAFELALGNILADIRDDLEEFGVRYDSWFSERSLADDGAIDHALDLLRAQRRRLREGRRAVVPRDRLRRREGPRRGARERRQDLLRLGHRLPPEQARARLRAAGRRARLGPPRLHRARARGPRRHGPAGRLPRRRA